MGEEETSSSFPRSYAGRFVFALIIGIIYSLVNDKSWDIGLIVYLFVGSMIIAGILSGIAKLYRWLKNRLF